MEENASQKEDLFFCMKNERSDKDDACQVITAVSENDFFKTTESEKSNDNNLNCTESLKFFNEHQETPHSKWIDSVQEYTRALERWKKEKKIDFQNMKGQGFDQCPLFHPHEDLPLAKQDGNGDFENPDILALEIALRRISKAMKGKLRCLQSVAEQEVSPQCKNRISPGINDEALATYCQQHAYSRSRLLRTDRRALANELLENFVMNSDDREMFRSDHSLVPVTSQISPQRLKTSKVKEPLTSISSRSLEENLNRNDFYQSHSAFPVRTRRNKNNGFERKESEHKTVSKNSIADMQQSFKITPCVFFPSQVLRKPNLASTSKCSKMSLS